MQDGPGNLKTLMDIMSAGIALNPHFSSTTLRSLTFLVHHFGAHVAPAHYVDLIDTAILLMKHTRQVFGLQSDLMQLSREVVGSTFELVRMIVVVAPQEVILQRVKDLVVGLCMYGGETRNKFKLKVRYASEIS